MSPPPRGRLRVCVSHGGTVKSGHDDPHAIAAYADANRCVSMSTAPSARCRTCRTVAAARRGPSRDSSSSTAQWARYLRLRRCWLRSVTHLAAFATSASYLAPTTAARVGRRTSPTGLDLSVSSRRKVDALKSTRSNLARTCSRTCACAYLGREIRSDLERLAPCPNIVSSVSRAVDDARVDGSSICCCACRSAARRAVEHYRGLGVRECGRVNHVERRT